MMMPRFICFSPLYLMPYPTVQDFQRWFLIFGRKSYEHQAEDDVGPHADRRILSSLVRPSYKYAWISSRALPVDELDKNDKGAKKRIGTKEREHILSESEQMVIMHGERDMGSFISNGLDSITELRIDLII